MKYAELSDRAKEKARDWYLDASSGDDFWSECVIEDFVEVASYMGFVIVKDTRKISGGRMSTTPRVCWEGFSTQGSGASFSAWFHFEGGCEATKRIAEHAPNDEELRTIAVTLETALAMFRMQYPKFDGLQLHVDTNTYRSVHSAGMSIGESLYDRMEYLDATLADPEAEDALIDAAQTVQDAVLTAAQALADWLYNRLETEWDYQCSEEAVADSCGANEYEFDEEGERL